MKCEQVQERISPLVDGVLPEAERENALAHIHSCKDCGARLESTEGLRAALRGLNRAPVPAELSARLRVMASHASVQRAAHSSLSNRWHTWADGVQLWFDNLMRPVALPVAGGIASALVLFGLLVPSLSFRHNFVDHSLFTGPTGEVCALDPTGACVPAISSNSPWIVRTDVDTPDDANVVWLTIDSNGKVADFAVERGQLTPELESIIMFSQFTPANILGLPMSSKVKAVQMENTLPRHRSLRS
jgi:Putative zinc-finger